MTSTLIIITLAVSAATFALCIYLALKMKTILYLLEQPVVKKMSPQLKLKPVKLDELMAEKNRQQQQQESNRPAQQNQHRPQHGGGRPHDRNDQERRPDSNRGERPENRDRFERRPDRPDGDRNRNQDRFRDRNRDNRHSGGNDRYRQPQTENRDAVSAPVNEAPRSQPAPIASETIAPLAPRRPLSATVDHEPVHTESTPASTPEAESNEGLFNNDDMKHGRRTQIKKKPRFEVAEEEIKATTEG